MIQLQRSGTPTRSFVDFHGLVDGLREGLSLTRAARFHKIQMLASPFLQVLQRRHGRLDSPPAHARSPELLRPSPALLLLDRLPPHSRIVPQETDRRHARARYESEDVLRQQTAQDGGRGRELETSDASEVSVR